MVDLTRIKNRRAKIIDQEKYRKSAVLVPLVNYQDEECLLFEVRSQTLNIQPGEICFPGGGVEPTDKNEEETAVRETCEELGLSTSEIEVIGPLDILITPFQFMITPFAARLDDYHKITLNKSEVESVFYVPVDFFLNNPPETYLTKVTISPQPDFPAHLLPNGKTYNWRAGSYPVHFYQYKDHTIWGITARIVENFVKIIKQT
ncbi:MAG: hypothetical protein VR72_04185 [Clostridiaceae bacterium BRH_c20a]|nr:MAG: hypothetical protein VR72_04185 [Clostridiaceae bacterium BRH_c20a]